MYYSPQWRDEDEEIVDDPEVIQLACWASGVYDQETWYSGQVDDEVWEVVRQGRFADVEIRIEAGASWQEAVDAALGRALAPVGAAP